MGATKPTARPDAVSKALTQIRNGGITRTRSPSSNPSKQSIIDLTKAVHHASTNAQHTNITDPGQRSSIPEEVQENVYLVMLDQMLYEDPYHGDERTEVFAVCADLEEANKQARRCLDVEIGESIEWEEYDEKVERDGTVYIQARGGEGEDMVVRIEKKTQKRKALASKSSETKAHMVLQIYIVLAETRKDVCGSNEEGEIESVEVQAVFQDLAAAMTYMRELVESETEDREDLKIEEFVDGGLPWMRTTDLEEGAMSVYKIVKQRLM